MTNIEEKISELQREIATFTTRRAEEASSLNKKREELRSKRKEKIDVSARRRDINIDLHDAGENKRYFIMQLSGAKNSPASEQTVILMAWPERHYRDYPFDSPVYTNEGYQDGEGWGKSFDLEYFSKRYSPSLNDLLSREKGLLVTADPQFTRIEPVLVPKAMEELEKKLSDSLLEIEYANAKIDKENSEINEQIKELQEKYEEKDRELRINVGRREHQVTYLRRAEAALSENPVIRKYSNFSVSDSSFYSIWVETSPVFLYSDGRLLFLHTTRKDKPLEIRSTSIDQIIGQENTRLAQELLGLEEDKFCTMEGYVLSGESESYVADKFEQVFTGVEILPSEDSPDGYMIRRRQAEEGEPTQPRHWGQVYLAQLRPERVITGDLLGSGGSYKAYVFGERTVVEFDQEERATFLFETDYFEGLRAWTRSRIFNSNPEGFEGRIIHTENRDLWKERVNDFLR